MAVVANENLRQCERAGSGVGTWSHGAVSLTKASGEQGTDSTATSSVRELRKQVRDFETPAGGEDSGSGFSKVPCKKPRLDAGAEATLARRHHGVVVPMQGSLK